ncbi:hypothetical protein RE943_18380 [Prescottella equi]|nr:hypothetical protein RE943_18380 [Prescottella equi]
MAVYLFFHVPVVAGIGNSCPGARPVSDLHECGTSRQPVLCAGARSRTVRAQTARQVYGVGRYRPNPPVGGIPAALTPRYLERSEICGQEFSPSTIRSAAAHRAVASGWLGE